MANVTQALSYEEPDTTNLLIIGSFLTALNLVDFILNKVAYCGLIGQVSL